MKARTLIVDDEPLARERLRALLSSEPDFEVLGECSDGRSALEAILRDVPDVVFLDVQMPEMDGFEVLSMVGDQASPRVVFVTAYDQFAVRAFDVHAVDYLLKPFDKERFGTALGRLRSRLKEGQKDEIATRLRGLLWEMRPESRIPERLAVKSAGRIVLVNVCDIDWVESADNYVELHVGNETHLLRETMTVIEGRLNPRNYVRINRSTLVNVTRVKELQPLFHGDYAVILADGTRLSLSRNYRENLERLMGQ